MKSKSWQVAQTDSRKACEIGWEAGHPWAPGFCLCWVHRAMGRVEERRRDPRHTEHPLRVRPCIRLCPCVGFQLEIISAESVWTLLCITV